MSRTLMAEGTIRPSRFVKVGSADHSCIEADANESVVGISHEATRDAPIPNASTNAAIDGDSLAVYTDHDECLLELGGTVTYGAKLKSDGDGKGVAAATTGTTLQNHGAEALEDGDSGDLIRVKVLRETNRPAIA